MNHLLSRHILLPLMEYFLILNNSYHDRFVYAVLCLMYIYNYLHTIQSSYTCPQ